ncbi:MAG: hypothetical protein RLZZ06_1099 [Actinomycetota bacterium]
MATKADSIRKKLRGFKMVTSLTRTSIQGRSGGAAWPIAANRLDQVGYLHDLSWGKGAVAMQSEADPELIATVLTGHRAKPKTRRYLLVTAIVPLLIVFSVIPLGKSPVVLHPKQAAQTNLCSAEQLTKWLEGDITSDPKVKLRGATILGGVTAGVIQCGQSRYSYTLGSKEPKRVLNFVKLDS